jgi:hypothetical protein
MIAPLTIMAASKAPSFLFNPSPFILPFLAEGSRKYNGSDVSLAENAPLFSRVPSDAAEMFDLTPVFL